MKHYYTTKFSPPYLWLLCCLLATSLTTRAQTVVATKCYSTASPTDIDGTLGATLPNVTFTTTDIPTGYVVTAVEVDVTWSYAAGSCASPTAAPVQLSDVGFGINSPVTGVVFAPSTTFAGFGVAPSPTFTGTSAVSSVTTTFSTRGTLPAAFPINAINGTFRSNGVNPLTDFLNTSPHGNWELVAIEDQSGGGVLCVQSYCVRVYACPNTLDAICKTAATLPLDASGVRNVTFADINNGSDTSCMLSSMTFTPSSFVCADVATSPHTVKMVLRDNLGHTDSCTTSVTVADTTRPVINCRNYTIYLPQSALFTMNAADSIQASDNCGSFTRRFQRNGGPLLNSVTYDCSFIGNSNLTLHVTDARGNIATCNVTVTVIDSTIPVPLCRNIQVALNATGQATVNALDIDNGSSDPCPPIASYTINGVSSYTYMCSMLGVNTATLRVTDLQGNSATCTSNITVVDNISPTVVCQNINAYVAANGSVTVPASAISNGSSDNCTPAASLVLQINGAASQTYTCTQVGSTQNVTLRATDAQGNFSTCAATIRVLDSLKPTALCRNATVFLNSAGSVTVPAATIDNASFDNCTSPLNLLINGQPSVTYTCANTTGGQLAVLRVADASGNFNTCTATITVRDQLPPTARCSTTYTAQLNGTGTAVVTPAQIDSLSSDNCSITSYFINGAASASYNCGVVNTTQTATLRVVDAAGQFSECTASILVRDTVTPIARCQSRIIGLAGTSVTVFPSDVDNPTTPSSDNCGALTYLINGQPSVTYNCSNAGGNNVVLQVTDGSGNVNTCSATLTIQDTARPVAVCRNISVYVHPGTTVAVFPSDIRSAASSDNCGITGATINGTTSVSYTCDSLNVMVGTRSALLTLSDAAGNTNTCTSIITVLDTTRPTAICQNRTVQLNAAGQAVVYPNTGANRINNNSTDNCGITHYLLNSADSVVFNCANLGSNTVQLSVRDSSGNIGTCNATVTVQDLIAPVARCSNTVFAYLAGNSVTVAANLLDSASTDNCGTLTYLINGNPSETYTCTNLGGNSAVLTVRDGNNNPATCIANVEVVDTIRPIATCNATTTVFLPSPTGSVTVTPTQIGSGSDNCSTVTLSINGQPSVTYTCSAVRIPQTAVLTVRDGSGNVSTCNAPVTVRDTITPVARCRNITLPLSAVTANGDTTLTPAMVDNGSTDNCSITNRTINGQPTLTFNCTNVGANTVNLMVADTTGNNSVCVATVTVVDNTRPVARCRSNITVYVSNTGTTTVAPVAVDNGSTDNCSIATMTLSRDTFSCGSVGAHNVWLRVFDAAGNVDSCQTVINVTDSIRPVARCSSAITAYLGANCLATITASQIDSLSSDNCGISSRIINGGSSVTFTNLNIATNPNSVTLVVSDLSGNTATCASAVTVRDTIRPTVTCTNINRFLGTTINVTAAQVATTSDNCGTPIMTINGQSSVTYTCANRGTNNVTIVSTDANGNTATCAAVVTIADTTRPTANCQAATVYVSNAGVAAVTAAQVNATSTDNCGIQSLSITPTSFTCSQLGAQTVTLTVTDSSANTATCQATVTVRDTIRPVALCRPDTIYLATSGQVAELPIRLDNTSTDNCGITSRLINGNASQTFTCAQTGLNTVRLTVVDASGNRDSCTTTVLVRDTIRPAISCQNITRQLNAVGQVIVNATELATASDTCGVILLINGSTSRTFTCVNRGNNNVVVTARDSSGNTSTCTAVLTIRDVTAPTAQCQTTTVALNTVGTTPVPAATIAATSNDACGIASFTSSPATVDCNSLGFMTVTITVTDSSGNFSTCTANINVVDTTSPTARCRPDTAYIDALSGIANEVPADIDNGSSDACGISSMLINGSSNAIFTCAQLGLQNVTLSVTDNNSNTSSCNTTVLVRDTVSPTARCSTSVMAFIVSGVATVQATQVDSLSRDNCSLNYTAFRINGQPSLSYNCTAVGTPQPVTLTVVDGSGNQRTCTSQVIVRDTTAPVAVCRSTPLSVNLSSVTNGGSVTVNPSAINGGSTDNCGITTYLINGQSSYTYTCSNRGANTATLTVRDAAGNTNTCTTTVTVNDNTSPIAQCRSIINAYVDNAGVVNIPARALDNGSTDNCGVASWTVNGADTVRFTCPATSPTNNLVVLTVRDSTGNASTCNAIIAVSDTTRPVARCSSSVVNVYLTTAGTANVTGNMIDNSSTDNCGITTYLINNTNSVNFTCTQRGNRTVTLTVRDAAGNNATCTATINVRDTVAPIARCQNRSIVLSGNPATATVNAAAINAGSTDNCSIASYLINNQASYTYNCSDVGVRTATLTVTDSSGNVGTCIATLTVTDNAAPVISCQPRTVFLDDNGLANVQPTQVATGTDGCSILSWTINGQSSVNYTCDSIAGTHIAIIRATDPSGNVATCQAAITVVDTTRPMAICQNIQVVLNAAGNVTVTPNQIDNASSDNCAITTYLINGQPSVNYTCSNVGAGNLATLTVRDASGNSRTCQAQIVVVDNIAPVANCRSSVTVTLDPSTGTVTLPAIALNGTPSSSDACSPLHYTVNGQTNMVFTCANVGTTSVILTVTDNNGNQSQCASLVNVVDNVPPVARCRDTVVYLDNAGIGTATPAMINNNSTDNCAIQSYRIDNRTSLQYTCANVGRDTVTLTVFDVNGNTSTCPSIITVRDTVAPLVVCQGTTVDLTQTGQFILTPATLDPNGATMDACGIDTMFVTPDTITCVNFGNLPVTLTAIDIYGNIAVCNTIVNVTLDGPQAIVNTPVCEQDTIFLTAVPPANGNTYTFSWSGPNGFTSTRQDTMILNADGANSGQYILRATPTGGVGCQSTDTAVVFVNVVVPPTISADTPTCQNDQALLFITNPTAYTGTNISYQWLFNNAATGTNNDTLTIANATLANTGNYRLVINVDGCSDTTAVPLMLDVHTLPPVPMPTSNDPCEGTTLTLCANPQDTARTYTYSWTGPNGFVSSAACPSVSSIQQSGAGIYTVLITDGFTCTATNTVSVTVAVTPDRPEVIYTQPLCVGDVLELRDTNTYQTPTLTFNWTLPDASTASTTVPQLFITGAQTGIYTLVVDMAGCMSAVDSVDVQYEPIPDALNDVASVPFRDSLRNINVMANDFFTGTTASITLVTTPMQGTATVNSDGTINYTPLYSFFGRDSFMYSICDAACPNSCDTAWFIVDVTTDFECFIPNAMSPNGDGINDLFNIRCLHEYPNRQLEIFNRWGNLVYKGKGDDFNGQFKGQDLPDGNYFYILKLNDTRYVADDRFTGWLVIHR